LSKGFTQYKNASIYGFRDVLLEDIDWPHGTRMRPSMDSETYCSRILNDPRLHLTPKPLSLAVGELLRGEMDADVRKKCEGVLDLVQHFRRANQGDDEDLVHDREEVGDGEMNGERRDKGVGQLNRAASDTSGITLRILKNSEH